MSADTCGGCGRRRTGIVDNIELKITDETYAAGEAALANHPVDKVFHTGIASDVLHAAVPLDRIAELERMMKDLHQAKQAMLEEGSVLHAHGLKMGIGIIRSRVLALRAGV